MRLQRLTGLERQKIVDEYEETLKLIEKLKAILASERMQLKIVIDELVALQEQFGDDASDGDRRARRGDLGRRPHSGRGGRDHRLAHRLREAHGAVDLPVAARAAARAGSA